MPTIVFKIHVHSDSDLNIKKPKNTYLPTLHLKGQPA